MTQPRLLGGRYELDGVVGRGGMAEVYRARDIRLDRMVAVKTLRSDLARDPTFQARFRREAQSAASLNHPSIIAVYDTGEDMSTGTPVPYIVMEYVDGRTLRDVLREDRQLLPERAVEIVDGILRALDYSHRGGIVHRDIKPANVMLTSTGEVKVMDFGIARAVADTAATMTQTAQVIGTAQYLSPEQARGERVDARSDIYSTGCVLYELLTGNPVFSGDSPVAIAYQHVREDPVPPSEVVPEIPLWADAIVLKAMAKDAAQRYQTAAEMRADIQRALTGMPLEAPTMALAGAGGTTAPTRRDERTAAIPPYQYGERQRYQRARRRGWGGLGWGLLAVGVIVAAAAAGWFLLGAGGADKVRVPSVLGLTQQAAEDQLKAAGLVPKPQSQNHPSIDKGRVIDIEPNAGEEVNKGSEVTLYVSAGPEQTTVPDGLVGLSQEEAEKRVKAAKLEVGIKRTPSGKPEGTVLAVKPKEGTKVTVGTTVTLTVSAGPETVPDVIGETEAEAKKNLTAAGFRVVVQYRQTTESVAGTVIDQSPKGGSKKPPRTTVTIVVAQEPQPTESPTEEPPPPFP